MAIAKISGTPIIAESLAVKRPANDSDYLQVAVLGMGIGKGQLHAFQGFGDDGGDGEVAMGLRVGGG